MINSTSVNASCGLCRVSLGVLQKQPVSQSRSPVLILPETTKTYSSNQDTETDYDLVVTSVVTDGGSGDDQIEKSHSNRHRRHQPKIKSDDQDKPDNPYAASNLARSSLSSPSSPVKTNNLDLGINPKIKDVEDL